MTMPPTSPLTRKFLYILYTLQYRPRSNNNNNNNFMESCSVFWFDLVVLGNFDFVVFGGWKWKLDGNIYSVLRFFCFARHT